MAKKTSYTGQSATELEATEAKLRKELFDLRFQHATRSLASSAELGKMKRELARVLTARSAVKASAKAPAAKAG